MNLINESARRLHERVFLIYMKASFHPFHYTFRVFAPSYDAKRN